LAKDRVVSEVRFEVEQIDQLFAAYADLLSLAEQTTPNLIEVTATASVLHSFYNGLENIFLSIAKGLDADVPSGPQSHRDLLTRMTQSTNNRDAVLTADMAQRLGSYLGFRHFYRHSYSFFLEWDEVAKLAKPLPEVWRQAKGELLQFLTSIDSDGKA
jgi:hypothetical protein